MRLGSLERRILAALLELRELEPYRSNYQRRGVRDGATATVHVRDRLWGRGVSASQRASFSRSLRTLEAKGLIRCRGATRLGAELTQEGQQTAAELNVNNACKPKMLTPQEMELSYRLSGESYYAAHGELPEDSGPPLRSREEEEAEEVSR